MFTTPKSSATQQPHSDVLRLSQKAPQYLEKQAVDGSAILLPFISAPKSSEVWNTYEQLLISCLRTGDDQSAHMCLERLIKRFGATNERVMGLRGLYQEAVAEDDAALENILKEYENALVEDPANTVTLFYGTPQLLWLNVYSQLSSVALHSYGAFLGPPMRLPPSSTCWGVLRLISKPGLSFLTCIWPRVCSRKRVSVLKRSYLWRRMAGMCVFSMTHELTRLPIEADEAGT